MSLHSCYYTSCAAALFHYFPAWGAWWRRARTSAAGRRRWPPPRAAAGQPAADASDDGDGVDVDAVAVVVVDVPCRPDAAVVAAVANWRSIQNDGFHILQDLGLVDFVLVSATVSQILLGLVRIRHAELA